MIPRRQFLQRLLSSAAAAAAARPRSAPAERTLDASPEIVDTHQHLWDLTKFRLPWIKPGSVLDRNFLTADYLEATRGLNVRKAVYMEVAVAPDQKLDEAHYILEVCRRRDNPTVAAVIGGDLTTPQFRSYITRFRDSSYIKGVRSIPRVASGRTIPYEDKTFVRNVQLLGELGMSFDLCPPVRQLPAAAALVDRCPGVRFILDHCGNADPKAFWDSRRREEVPGAAAPTHEPQSWRRDIAELARRPHVVCKISGIITRAPAGEWRPEDLAPIVHHCLDCFGPNRVMFAGDWPVCTRVAPLRDWVGALKQIVARRSEQEQRKLFSLNATRFYRLG